MGSHQNRFPLLQQERRKRWEGCWGGLSCFRTQKGGKRIVPASLRIAEGNNNVSVVGTHQQNQSVGLANHQTNTGSLLAPPSSPASFTNSAIPSTAQSPRSCFLSLSANSPLSGPSSTMFATGPYAHETQLVSPPVFSTYTTEPSTAPLTPPPELAHFLTTPSSPDVPFAQYLSSSNKGATTATGLKTNNYGNDLQAAYSLLYPRSPHGSNSGVSPFRAERDFHPHWDHPQNSQDSNFFCPATFAQFYLDDHSQQTNPHSGGRLSLSKESDVVYSSNNNNNNNGHHHHQNKHVNSNKSCKQQQDVEEIEAYRASFGFSADEIITSTHYVEISDPDVLDDSFTITPFASTYNHKLPVQEKNSVEAVALVNQGPNESCHKIPVACNGFEDDVSKKQGGTGNRVLVMSDDDEEDDIFAKMRRSKSNRKYYMGSTSDAEIDYRRVRSLKQRTVKGS